MKRLVFATYVSPFPPNSGERIRALNLIAALSALGYRVEAFVGNYDGVDLAARDRDGVTFRQIPFAWPRLRQEAGIYFRGHPEFIRQLAALHRERPFAAAILDYGFMGAQVGSIARLGMPVVLGSHNVESHLTGQVPASSLLARAAILLRQAIESTHERWFFPRADALICVSDQDRDAYERFIPADRLHVVPNFVDIPDRFGTQEKSNRIVMSGSFTNFQNLEGLKWFASKVWDEELQAKTSLYVVGKHSAEAVRALGNIPGIVGAGPREDLLTEIAASRCSIVPLLHGGGTRMKCLEAMAARTPVVTTSKGCEGIGHTGAFWVADSPANFKRAIVDILGDDAKAGGRAAQARGVFDRTYSLQANMQMLEKVLAAATLSHARRVGTQGLAAAE
jgi:glycosyltransferase involved in cell wall biosynthesis